jgi:hypothetical protein
VGVWTAFRLPNAVGSTVTLPAVTDKTTENTPSVQPTSEITRALRVMGSLNPRLVLVPSNSEKKVQLPSSAGEVRCVSNRPVAEGETTLVSWSESRDLNAIARHVRCGFAIVAVVARVVDQGVDKAHGRHSSRRRASARIGVQWRRTVARSLTDCGAFTRLAWPLLDRDRVQPLHSPIPSRIGRPSVATR